MSNDTSYRTSPTAQGIPAQELAPELELANLEALQHGFIGRLGPGSSPTVDEVDLIWSQTPDLMRRIKAVKKQLGENAGQEQESDAPIVLTPGEIENREDLVARLLDPNTSVDELDRIYASIQAANKSRKE